MKYIVIFNTIDDDYELVGKVFDNSAEAIGKAIDGMYDDDLGAFYATVYNHATLKQVATVDSDAKVTLSN